MTIQPGNYIAAYTGAVQAARQPLPATPSASAAEEKEGAVRRFDSVTISSGSVGRNSVIKAQTAKISQEVQASTTTGALAALRRQIRAGEFQPDPGAIARKLLWLGEEA